MFEPQDLHQCAMELERASQTFRQLYAVQTTAASQQLAELSRRGLDLLQRLGLTLRNEQDYGRLEQGREIVGITKDFASRQECIECAQSYPPPFVLQVGWTEINLRGGLNKILHADAATSSFRATPHIHELVLVGQFHNQHWVAVVSMDPLCRAVLTLPNGHLEGRRA